MKSIAAHFLETVSTEVDIESDVGIFSTETLDRISDMVLSSSDLPPVN